MAGYSMDLRERVVAAVEAPGRKSVAGSTVGFLAQSNLLGLASCPNQIIGTVGRRRLRPLLLHSKTKPNRSL